MRPAELRALQLRASLALAEREAQRVVSLWSQTVAPPVVTAGLFLAVFGGALGSRIGTVEGVDYLAFILPGLLVTTVAGQSLANSATSLYQAKSEGYIDDLLTSPLRSWQLVAAYAAGGLLRAWAAALVVALVAAPFAGVPDRPLLAGLALALAALVFAPLGVVTGVWAESFDRHAFVANLVVTPLALLGGVFYSAGALAEPWETLTRIDPLFYLVDATRAGFTGVHEAPPALALAVAAACALLAFAAATALVAAGRRLRP